MTVWLQGMEGEAQGVGGGPGGLASALQQVG